MTVGVCLRTPLDKCSPPLPVDELQRAIIRIQTNAHTHARDMHKQCSTSSPEQRRLQIPPLFTQEAISHCAGIHATWKLDDYAQSRVRVLGSCRLARLAYMHVLGQRRPDIKDEMGKLDASMLRFLVSYQNFVQGLVNS